VCGVAHVQACGFYCIARYQKEMDPNWVVAYYQEYYPNCAHDYLNETHSLEPMTHADYEVWRSLPQNLGLRGLDCVLHSVDSTYSVYLSALYWAFVTVTTVGYGDIAPKNDNERMFVMIMDFVGTAIFAITVGQITAMVGTSNVIENAYAEQKAGMEDFLRRQNVPKYLRKLIREHYRTNCDRIAVANQTEIVDRLSPSLRKAVQIHIKKGIVSKVMP
jgi:hypothetical protein